MTLAHANVEAGGKMAIAWKTGLLPLLVLVGATLVLAPREPAWAFMWLFAFAMWAGCKWAMLGRQGIEQLVERPGRFAGWILWPGMDSAPFSAAHSGVRPALREWGFAIEITLLGFALAWIVAGGLITRYPLAAAWFGGIGLILMLHFGSFHLLTLAWRAAGVPVRSLMRNPLAATSLAEFWGRRWNTAFQELAHQFVFTPVARRRGGVAATVMTFAVSGIIHDLVISVPARGGYSLPTAYFLVQGAGILFERSRLGSRLGLKCGVRGWLFTMLVIVGPVFWLFHPTFMREVMLPFLRMLTDH